MSAYMVWDYTHWKRIVQRGEPTILLNYGGGYMTTLRYQMSEDRRDRPLSRVGSACIVLTDQWHFPSALSPEQSGDTCYLTLLWYPEVIKGKYVQSHEENLTTFSQSLLRWSESFFPGFASWKWCDPDETCTYLHQCVTLDFHPVTAPRDADQGSLSLEVAHGFYYCEGNPPYIESLPKENICTFVRHLRVKPRGKNFVAQIRACLDTVPFPIRFTTRYIPVDKWRARTAFERVQQKCLQLIRAEVGHFTPSITVWGATREELNYREWPVVKMLRDQGFVAFPETTYPFLSWIGSLPGHNT